jgi:subtilisin family serine protease
MSGVNLSRKGVDGMKKRLFLLVNALILVFYSSVLAGQYTSDFPDYLADMNKDQTMVSAIISMADGVDLRTLQDRLYSEHADRQAWHEAVVLALREKASTSQADIIARLDEMVAANMVEKYHQLWVGNIIIVSASHEALDELVARQDVDEIAPDYEIETINPTQQADDNPIIAGHEIGLQRINADQCWAIGITGQGRLVSNIDTGVLGTHAALTNRWAGNDPRYSGHPEWAWLDPYTTNWPTPQDDGGHGTHTMGTICGRTASGDTVGVAIDAQWIAAAAIDRGGGIPRTVSDALISFEWITDPDDDPGTVWDVPDVCSNSWGVTTSHGYPPCDETFWNVIDGCEAAGCVVVFAAGNEGPGASTLRRPSDRATTPLSTFSVGAVDGSSPNLPIASFSSRGPSNCTPDGSATFKPEVCAPGVNVRSSYNNGGYTTMSGTSMATPHIAGVVALVRQANPNLTSEQVKQIIYDTARDLGNPGEDNTYGNGVADAYAAVQMAMAYLEGWGTLGGVITDQASGNPIAGATIAVQDRPWNTVSRANGQYFIFMPADTAWTIRVDYPPTHLPIIDTITVPENDTLIQDYALEGKVTVTIKASFANPQNVSYRPFYIMGSWNTDGFYDDEWSAPAIRIRDNGVSPDQTAGDGIFTGTVMLARDLVNTYNWAIYSENYNDQASRLQYGSGFQILNLTPPAVPTLAVNPSGSDNNWVITAFGDHGVNLDLTQNINNEPYEWGAAMALDSAVVYTFKFRVMHSTVASYGIGGVGGTDIVFNCQYTGSYDFLFSDGNDSYIVQLAGTEGPPQALDVISGLDSHIWLDWSQPGARDVLAGYNLYRSTSPNPYHGGDIAYRVNGSLISANSYDDWGGVLDSIVNGIQYHYQVSAIYDIGGGQFVEVGPSNEVTGTAQNHPPYAPFGLIGTVNDRTVNASWSFGDSARDLAHFNIYKKLMPDGNITLAGTSTTTSFQFDVPTGEDGVYQISVKAVDDGTPPLESGPSRAIFLAVGHLPPTNLVAVSGMDSNVPLSWNLPGAWRENRLPEAPIIQSNDNSAIPDQQMKGVDDPIGPPMLLGRGGPDTFGYEWIDSDESDGPAYSWIDISGVGVEITPWPNGTVDDGYTNPIPMGMEFDYYGITYTDIVVSTNGWVSFLAATSSYLGNTTMPNTTNPNALLAVEWDDLDGGTVGHCYYYYDSANNQFIVSWVNWPYYPDATGPAHNLQVILDGNSNNIIMQYGANAGDWQTDVTVGIENETGTDGLQVTANQAYLHSDMAISYSTGSEGIAPVHFKLYRATTPNVPLDPAHLIAGNIAGDLSEIVDSNNIQNGTTYYYKLTAVWSDSIESPPTNEASATPVSGAHMTANPTSYEITGHVGEINTANLTIGNTGGLDLNFSIAANTENRIAKANQRRDTYDNSGIEIETPTAELKDIETPTNPPMLLGRGGPDTFGYEWIDSDEPGGPIYNWVDITTNGVEITPWPHGTVDDGYTDPIPMGMTFNFYGIAYTDVVVSTNGWISFLPATSSYLSNTAIPTAANPNAIIAVEWDDLDGGTVGHCYYYYDATANEFIVSWVDWPYYPDGTGPSHNLQVILKGNGTIVAQYGTNAGDWQTDVTVGIENETGTDGLQVANGQAYLHSEMAILYSTGWLSTNPLGGVISPGGNQVVSVIFDATSLEVGTYNGSLVLSGYDAHQPVDNITIPVVFHVQNPDAVEEGISELPSEFALKQNYPNPFNPSTIIQFDLPKSGAVSIVVYNVLGQSVRTLVNSEQRAGYHTIIWDGADDAGMQVSSGTYFYILKAGDKSFTKKMTLVR